MRPPSGPRRWLQRSHADVLVVLTFATEQDQQQIRWPRFRKPVYRYASHGHRSDCVNGKYGKTRRKWALIRLCTHNYVSCSVWFPGYFVLTQRSCFFKLKTLNATIETRHIVSSIVSLHTIVHYSFRTACGSFGKLRSISFAAHKNVQVFNIGIISCMVPRTSTAKNGIVANLWDNNYLQLVTIKVLYPGTLEAKYWVTAQLAAHVWSQRFGYRLTNRAR